MAKLTNYLLNSTNSSGFDFSMILYIIEIFFILAIMYALMYLSFSIVKKSQVHESIDLDAPGADLSKAKVKVLLKNQIEMIQNGIVCVDSESYIIPARRNRTNHIFDDECPKIKHLNSVKYEIFDRFEDK